MPDTRTQYKLTTKYIDKPLRNAIRLAAKKEGLKISDWMIKIMKEELDRQGIQVIIKEQPENKEES